VQYLLGDHHYVLIGFPQHRSAFQKTDSSCQPFCRICLADETDRPLQKLICQLSAQRDRVWATADEIWGVDLWNMEPTCQVAGVEADDALVICGPFAVSIQWEDLSSVDCLS
jgi:hypothetical protein